MRLDIPAVARMLRHDLGHDSQMVGIAARLPCALIVANWTPDFSTIPAAAATSCYDKSFREGREPDDHRHASQYEQVQWRSFVSTVKQS